MRSSVDVCFRRVFREGYFQLGYNQIPHLWFYLNDRYKIERENNELMKCHYVNLAFLQRIYQGQSLF